jgi:hypothetical protein
MKWYLWAKPPHNGANLSMHRIILVGFAISFFMYSPSHTLPRCILSGFNKHMLAVKAARYVVI